MEKIKIALIVGKFNDGGVESVIMNYYNYINHDILHFDFICDNDSFNIPYEEIKKYGDNIILIPPYQKHFLYKKELFKVFKDNNYLIVHSHINSLSCFPLRIAKKCNIPIRIVHNHSTSSNKEVLKNFLKNILKKFSKIYATEYFACSKYAGNWLFGKSSFYIVNNAIDVEKFKYNELYRKELRKQFNINKNALVIGHVGRFVKAKNHEFLIKVFFEIYKQKKNSVLFLVGCGSLKNKIKKLVKKLKIEKNVIFLDYRRDIYKLYSAFDIFLLPSLYEGLPLVGIESQASGLFCIFSTNVTKEVQINDNSMFISLRKNSREWAQLILSKYYKIDRKNAYKKLLDSDYNINNQALALTNKYLELLVKIKNCENIIY